VAVAGGLIAVDAEYAGQTGLDNSGEPLIEDLTGREREVLGLMAEGMSNKTIALRLEISEHTVKFHVNAILRKLGAQSRTEAVVRATRLGLILL
jgi:DNA-binding NarL/FixJ family response regulator